jgi:DNA polymerase-3 subunit epsilon
VAAPFQLSLPLPGAQPGAEGHAGLADRLCALLERRGRPLEVGQVVAQLLRVRRCPERLGRLLVAEIVDGDARLAWRERDLVGLAPPGWACVPLDEATFCVVDLETTGGSPGLGRITEIGAVRVTGLEAVDRFVTLVDPERPIPPVITAITGIDDALVRGEPTISTALDRFAAFAGDDVLVAHNAPFDLRFLNYERRRLAGRYFTQPWLDTLVLARRLLRRRVERHDLGTLAAWADCRTRPCHRALPDAEATAELLVTFLQMLAERGHGTLERAVAFSRVRGARHSYKLALAEDLPATPGVYLMRDRRGQVLYVGKAVNLRRRVRSYFGPQGRHGRLIGRALEQLERVDHEPLGSEFEAMLRESRLLHELRPPCNRRGLGGRAHYLKLTVGEPFPRLYAVPHARDDGALYFGPLRTERLAREAVRAVHDLYPLRGCHPVCGPTLEEAATGCAGPCGGGDAEAYGRAVAEVRALLEDEAPAALTALGRRIAAAPIPGGPLAREDGREGIASLVGALAALSRLRAAAARSAVLLEPDGEPGRVAAFFVAGGRVVHRDGLTARGWRRGAARGLAAIAGQPPARGPLVSDALDEVGIVAQRMRERLGHPAYVPLEPGWRLDRALAAVGAGVAAVLAERRVAVEDSDDLSSAA